LHFFTASIAVAGILVALIGLLKRRQDSSYSRWAVRYGLLWFIIATLVQLGVGTWFFLTLPETVRMMFMGGDGFATLVFSVALTCAIGSLVFMLLGLMSAKPFWKALTGIVLISLTVICMVLVRDIVRSAALQGYFDASRFSVAPQTGVIILFFFLLLAGLGVIGYMLKRVAASR
jgi:hypothetical protein